MMESIKEIYKIGHGPSSSHTMGPRKAAQHFLNQTSEAYSYKVTLYGSLAATAKGHLTHTVLNELFEGKRLEIIEKPEVFLHKHPNGMKFEAFDVHKNTIKLWTAYSIGGGSVIDDNSSPVSLIGVTKEENLSGGLLRNLKIMTSGITWRKYGKL